MRDKNIILGQKGRFFIKEKKLSKEIKDISQKFDLQIDPDKKIYDMAIGEKQNIEIFKVLYRGADILILDEPTAVLTPQETKKLFKIINNMKKQGCAVIIITHKLNEVMEISDRVTILRKGETIKTVDTKSSTPKTLTDLMVGKSTNLSIERVETKKTKSILSIKNLVAKDREKVEVLKNIDFELKAGEILGVSA